MAASHDGPRIVRAERQLRDVLQIILVQGDRLDGDYLDRWAKEFGVQNQLDELRFAFVKPNPTK